jgi:ABC-type sugar transport system ATPase subunit
MSDACMLRLDGVAKRFGAVAVVRDLQLELGRGEFVSLLGPSGCGKSTTLAIIAGLLEPDAGRIEIGGVDVRGLPPQRRRVGLVFQDYALFSRLTVRENLLFGLKARHVGRRERERRLQGIVERLELAGLLDRAAASLNLSDMQRVAIGRALVTEPALLLLDEPMSNLDPHLRQRLRSELKQMQIELGQTVLYVTHDQVEAMSMSDRIAVMHGGQLQQLATPHEIFRRPVNRFVAEFIGDPPINLLPCRIGADPTGLRLTSPLTPTPARRPGFAAPDGDAELAIRPHHIRAHRSPSAGSVPATVRLVENLGARHVLHVGIGDQLVRVIAPPHLASEGEQVHLTADLDEALLLSPSSGAVISPRRHELAA